MAGFEADRKAMEAISARMTPAPSAIRVLRIRERTDRRALVNRFARFDGFWPLMRWLSSSPLPVGRLFCCTDEAIACFRRALRRARLAERNVRAAETSGNALWIFKTARELAELSGIAAMLRPRLIVARYFSRFGGMIWQREAA